MHVQWSPSSSSYENAPEIRKVLIWTLSVVPLDRDEYKIVYLWNESKYFHQNTFYYAKGVHNRELLLYVLSRCCHHY